MWLQNISTILFLALVVVMGKGVFSQSNSIWQMDVYLSKHVSKIEELAAEKLEPLVRFPDIQLNMTFPYYLTMSGNLTNFKFEGAGGLTHNYSYTSPTLLMFRMYAVFPQTILYGKHNFQGVITLDNGTAIPIGGGERIFKLTTSPAKGSWQFHTELDEQRRIVMQGFSESFGIDLNPSPYTLWEMDMGGLLDPIAFDRDLLENAEYWISTEILERIKTNFRGLEDQIAKRIEPAYVKVLQEAFRTITIDEIMSIPPTTTLRSLGH
ncbi:uncharacterized protein LOC110844583 [Folsomia candida]|uniref:Uncharacterized protein n=1 Tax=Folsomia candida TaxID=158441 RepID=A0A226ERI5_FOLCA|nr:uncharacterized protein LOC110844583 [Folsomia candida]OXA59818.1 hypothetical protein Fcan01_04739 [Folsomia candida]